MKTPKELAIDYCEPLLSDDYAKAIGREDWIGTRCVKVGDGHEMYKAFIAGYQAAAPQWISVKDRLPDSWDEYLVNIRNHRCELATFTDFINSWCLTGSDAAGLEDDITHWMPLPKPPTENSK